ncbi:MAG TPA: hypothetical protein VHX37_07725 [Acidobacteriaceae bacterium]|nr:hypothetical protein [Acidobacteriaceae bacterium]
MSRRMLLTVVAVLTTLFWAIAIPVCWPLGGSQEATGSWMQFEDPLEHAFSLEVPAGWQVRGGLFRLGYSDERPMVDLQSPDGSMEIRLGDVAIPSYALPNPLHAQEGKGVDLGAQAQLVVARYRTGPEFAVLYSQARFGNGCRDAQADAGDANFSPPDYLPQGSQPAQDSAGSIAYRCTTPDGPKVVVTYARTSLAQGIWQAETLVSVMAAPGNIGRAKAIALRCAQSFQLNSEWVEYQKQMDADGLQYQRMRQQGRWQQIAEQVRPFEAQMQAMQSQVSAFERQQPARAAQAESFTNVLNGITPATDPLTGEQRIVWTGSNAHYWVNGLGHVVNASNAPSGNWHPLQPNP